MKRFVGWRMASVAVAMTAMMATWAQAQQPTVVFSIRGIDALLDDAEFLGAEVGKEGAKATAEQLASAFTGGKGLAGINQKKPLGIYWNATAGGPPEMPVVFIPVSDEAALKGLLSDLAADFQDSKGQWSATVNGTRLYGKVSAGYLFISPVPVSKVADPARITNGKYDISLDVNIASIPPEFKGLFLTQAEANGRQAMETGPEARSEAERVGRELGFSGALAVLKSLINDGERLTLGVDVDQKTRLGAVDLALTGKSNSGLAKLLAAYARTQPFFAGLGTESAPFRLVISHPTPDSGEELETVFDAFRLSINQSIENDARLNNDDDRAAAKGLAGRLVNIFQATVKSGSLHSGIVLESGGGGKLRVIGGAKVANGDDAGKLLDDVIKLSKENPDLAKVKVDAARHAGARIHAVTPDQNDETKQYFGDEPAHLAFRTDSLWMSIGGDNLNALKKALDARTGARTATSPISLQIKPAALVVLMEKDNEALIDRAKGVMGKPGDKLSVDLAPIDSGARLRVEAGIDLLRLAEIAGEN